MQKTASNPDDIDAVIVATTTPDYHFPSTASIPVSYTHLDVYKRQTLPGLKLHSNDPETVQLAIASVKVLHGCRQLVP